LTDWPRAMTNDKSKMENGKYLLLRFRLACQYSHSGL
jgi:hypothetical protein